MAPQEEPPLFSRELARINDKVIKEDVLRFRLHLEMDKYPAGYFKQEQEGSQQPSPLRELADDVLNHIINDYTIIAYGEAHQIKIDENELDQKIENRKKQWNPKSFENFLSDNNISYARWRQLVEDEIRVQQIMESELGTDMAVTLDEVSDYYRRNSEEFAVGERVKVRHIVTDSLEKANELHDRLMLGENFAKVAINHSLSPDRARGGDLGYFAKGTHPKEFDEACFKLNKGEISPVVKSDYGYHIFKLLGRKPAGKKDLEEVAAQIQQKLFEEKLKKKYEPWIQKVKKQVKVLIHQEVLDHLVL